MSSMSRLNIAVVGAGQLGSRHLQSLASLGRPATVTVLDPSAASLETAHQRFELARTQARVGEEIRVRYEQDIQKMSGDYDIAIVATTADRRRQAIEDMLSVSSVRALLLEKVLFQRRADYAAIHELLMKTGTVAWVNCAQRLWPFFRDLKPRLMDQRNVQILVQGSQWGLGCNAIHNLDLLAFFKREEVDEIRLDANFDPGVVPSKRPGFIEFTGTLYAHGKDGFSVGQTSHRDGHAPFVFQIISNELHHIWHVAQNKALIAEAADGWVWREVEVKAPFQSSLTSDVTRRIVDDGDCELPTYTAAAALHLPMLDVFLRHLATENGAGEVCPIT